MNIFATLAVRYNLFPVSIEIPSLNKEDTVGVAIVTPEFVAELAFLSLIDLLVVVVEVVFIVVADPDTVAAVVTADDVVLVLIVADNAVV